MNLNVNTIYWINPAWNFYRVFDRLLDPVKRLVGAIRSGLIASSRDISVLLDGIINPNGISLENIWTGYGTGTSVSVAVVPTAVSNGYFVAVITTDETGGGSVSVVKLSGSSMTSLTGGTATNSGWIYGFLNPSAGSYNFTCTLATSSVWRVVCYQLSGVNQTTPTLDAQTSAGTTTPITVTLATVNYGYYIDGIRAVSGIGYQNGQTITTVNSLYASGRKAPAFPQDTPAYSQSGTTAWRLNAVSLNPA